MIKATLNIVRIVDVEPSTLPYRVYSEDLCKLFLEPNENPPIVLEITKERNSLERFLLQFASFDRKTEYDPERDVYTCQISYDMSDETELLIRILSFGPTVKVLGPQSFLDQVKERLIRQLKLMNMQPQ
jgi:predicted DNA-binding transcriptional regulator YafY